MNHRKTLIATAILVALSALFVSGCKQNRTMISSILSNPGKYSDRDVIVAGEVTKTYGVNLFISEAGAYQIDDGSGNIWVITKNGLPREGAKVGLKGTVGNGIRLGRESFGTIIREHERKTK